MPRSSKRRGKSEKRESGQPRALSEKINVREFKGPETVTFPKTVIGFPDRLVTILKYTDLKQFSGAAAPAAQKWGMNNAYDPDISGAGHQPSYFDIFSSVYGRYYVRQFKLEVELFQDSGASVDTEFVVCYSDVDVSANTLQQLVEGKYNKRGVLTLPAAGGSSKKCFLPWMTSTKIMGTPFTEADDNMYATVGASPTDQAFGIVKVAAIDGLTNVSVRYRTVIYMEVCFKDLTVLYPSLAKQPSQLNISMPTKLNPGLVSVQRPVK